MRQCLLLGLSIACVPGEEPLPGSTEATGGSPPPAAIEIGPWQRCAWRPGVDTDGAECALASVPLDYADPDGSRLQLLVKRLQARGEETGQYWALHGGPGASAVDDLAGLSYRLPEDLPDISYYAVDHRGIGGSARLSCPDQESPGSEAGSVISGGEWAACIDTLRSEWGDDLAHVSTTASARDIGELIGVLADPEIDVLVYGGSYGTYLAQRYLALFPDQAAGVILDGIMPADRTFVGYDDAYNEIAHRLMDMCAADPGCADRFDGDPWSVADRVVDAMDHGHCAFMGSTSEEMRTLLGYFTLYATFRDYVPAFVHRLERCDLDDVYALLSFVTVAFGGASPGVSPPSPLDPGNDGLGRSDVLGRHISLSELWDPDLAPTEAEARASFEDHTMSLGIERELAALQDAWPTFGRDAHWGTIPERDGPLLLLQGGLDPATVPSEAERVRDAYAAPLQTWAYFPYGAHGIPEGTPTASGEDCGYALLRRFVEAPEQPLDVSCVADSLPPDFDGDPLTSSLLFGSTDPWGG